MPGFSGGTASVSLPRYSGGGLGRGSSVATATDAVPSPALPRNTGGGRKKLPGIRPPGQSTSFQTLTRIPSAASIFPGARTFPNVPATNRDTASIPPRTTTEPMGLLVPPMTCAPSARKSAVSTLASTAGWRPAAMTLPAYVAANVHGRS